MTPKRRQRLRWEGTDGNGLAKPYPLPSILRHLRINLIRPSQNPARQVMHLLETRLPQESNCLAASNARPAVRDDFAARVKLMDSFRQIPERDEISVEIADLVFVRFAH